MRLSFFLPVAQIHIPLPWMLFSFSKGFLVLFKFALGLIVWFHLREHLKIYKTIFPTFIVQSFLLTFNRLYRVFVLLT
jgi:hypothetical protein